MVHVISMNCTHNLFLIMCMQVCMTTTLYNCRYFMDGERCVQSLASVWIQVCHFTTTQQLIVSMIEIFRALKKHQKNPRSKNELRGENKQVLMLVDELLWHPGEPAQLELHFITFLWTCPLHLPLKEITVNQLLTIIHTDPIKQIQHPLAEYVKRLILNIQLIIHHCMINVKE